MLKYLNLILKNLGRNKLRTTLTALAVMVLVSIYSIVNVVVDRVGRAFDSYSSQSRLIIRERWVQPSVFPDRYVNMIANVDGVEDWTAWHLFAGSFDESKKLFGIATVIDNLHELHPGFEDFDTSLIDAMQREKSGILIGRAARERLNLRIGQKFSIDSITPPGKRVVFKVVGIYDNEIFNNSFFFHRKYYREAIGGEELVNVMWLRVRDPETGKRVAAKIEKMFENSPAQIRAETESAGIGRISGRISTTINIINLVTTILLLDMVMILSNSISMTVRERHKEMAILKVLGFQPATIIALVIGEAMIVGAVSGGLGAGLSHVFTVLNNAGELPFQLDYMKEFPVTAEYIPRGIVLGALVGLVGSILPAWNTRKVKIADVFSAGG